MSLAVYVTDKLYCTPQGSPPFFSLSWWPDTVFVLFIACPLCVLLNSGMATVRDTPSAKVPFMLEKFPWWPALNETPYVQFQRPLSACLYLTCWKVMRDSESFKWCFMGGTALCALLQQICNIPPWTDLDSIPDYSSWHLRVFLSEPFRSITSVLFALVWIIVWPQIVHFCFNVKLLWGGYGKVYCFVYCSQTLGKLALQWKTIKMGHCFCINATSIKATSIILLFNIFDIICCSFILNAAHNGQSPKD